MLRAGILISARLTVGLAAAASLSPGLMAPASGAVPAGQAGALARSLRWQRPVNVDRPGGGLTAVSCPSVILCLAIDRKGFVIVSHAPRFHNGAWRRSRARIRGGSAIVCRTTRLCVIADGRNAYVSRRPTGGQASWSRVLVDHAAVVSSISCPTISLCVAVDEDGNVLTSTTPSGTTPWSSAHVDAAADNEEGGLYAVSCPSLTFCAAVDDLGNVLASRTPTGGAEAWQSIPVRTGFAGEGGLLDLSCPSAQLCVAVEGVEGDAVTSTAPLEGTSTWRGVAVSPASEETSEGRFEFVHCDFATLCVAADNLGHVYSTTIPTGRSSAWGLAEFELTGVSCPAPSVCIGLDKNGAVRIGRL
jgi:hypothetical protein